MIMSFTQTYQYSKKIVIYISSFVAKKVLSKALCTECSAAVIGNNENLENTFLAFKNQGGLIFPSDDIIQICMHSEVTLRSFSSYELLTASLKERLKQDILNKFINKHIYADDVVLMAEDEEGMKKMIKGLKKYLKEKGLELNIETSKMMRFKKGGGREKKVE